MSKTMERYEYPEDMWLWEELDELDAELEASGIEDATAWERWGEMEEVLMMLAERYTWRENYPREQYEADRAKAIEDGENPRCIMSYSECMAYDMYQAELEREREAEEAYWDAVEEYEREEAEREVEELAELAEMAEENALTELEVFGNVEPWFYGEPEVNVFGVDYKTRVWSEERIFADDEEYAAWDAATDDIPEKFFELDWSM